MSRQLCLTALLGLLLVPALTGAQSMDVRVTWTAPTKNLDGSDYTDGAGFKIYGGPSITQLQELADVADPGATSAIVRLPHGRYLLTVAAYNEKGNVSPPGQGITLDTLRPSAPSALACGTDYALLDEEGKDTGVRINIACR